MGDAHPGLGISFMAWGRWARLALPEALSEGNPGNVSPSGAGGRAFLRSHWGAPGLGGEGSRRGPVSPQRAMDTATLQSCGGVLARGWVFFFFISFALLFSVLKIGP